METRHNTQALERAIDLILRKHEAGIKVPPAAVAPVISQTTRPTSWLAIAGILALLILVLAFAFRIIETKPVQIQQAELPPSADKSKTVSSQDDQTKNSGDTKRSDIVTTDFTIFKNTTVFAAGKSWDVTAGHAFATQEDQARGHWQHAWCYFKASRGKLDAQISLGDRNSSDDVQSQPDFDGEFVAGLGLSELDIESMASKCPWLDGRSFNVASRIAIPIATSKTQDGGPGIINSAGKGDLGPTTVSQPPPTELTDYPVVPEKDTETVQTGDGVSDVQEALFSWVGMDAAGGDIANMPLKNLSMSECQSACKANGACKLATYNTKFRACYLKDTVGKVQPNGTAVTFYRKELNDKMIELAKGN